jgi:hypothetical protein
MSPRHDVVQMALAGEPPRLIAGALGIKPNMVHYHLTAARKSGVQIPKFKRGAGWAGARFLVALDPSIRTALAPAAAQRGIDQRELAARILTVIVNDQLIDAVLADDDTNL